MGALTIDPTGRGWSPKHISNPASLRGWMTRSLVAPSLPLGSAV